MGGINWDGSFSVRTGGRKVTKSNITARDWRVDQGESLLSFFTVNIYNLINSLALAFSHFFTHLVLSFTNLCLRPLRYRVYTVHSNDVIQNNSRLLVCIVRFSYLSPNCAWLLPLSDSHSIVTVCESTGFEVRV